MGSTGVQTASAEFQYATGKFARGVAAPAGYLRRPGGHLPAVGGVCVAGTVPNVQPGSATAGPQRFQQAGSSSAPAPGPHPVPDAIQPVWSAESGPDREQTLRLVRRVNTSFSRCVAATFIIIIIVVVINPVPWCKYGGGLHNWVSTKHKRKKHFLILTNLKKKKKIRSNTVTLTHRKGVRFLSLACRVSSRKCVLFFDSRFCFRTQVYHKSLSQLPYTKIHTIQIVKSSPP